MDIEVNYNLFTKANEYYGRCCGFKYIHVDWMVDEDVNHITKPADSTCSYLGDRTLVASGEQSFLQKIKDKQLEPGAYMTITPCFRLCDNQNDGIHLPYFMKHELIIYEPKYETDEYYLASIAKTFFTDIIGDNNFLEIIETDMGLDIEYKGVEIGSYGVRNVPGYGKWCYGTGLAEPRFSSLLNYLNK